MAITKSKKNSHKMPFTVKVKRYGNLFPFLIPAIVLAIIFNYVPMSGLVMAFKENPNLLGSDSAVRAIIDAQWAGLEHFRKIFSLPEFKRALANTLIISSLKIVIVFPLPIILAILVNEMRGKKLTKVLQIVMYLPYFLSWAIIAGIFITILNESTGMVNNLLESLGHSRINFISSNDHFRQVLVGTTAWKDIGWSAITYMAAITSMDSSLAEAGKIDGASKWQQITKIIIPSIMPTIATMFILRIGYVMDAGFEQVFVFYSPFVQQTGDILGTYTYRLIRQSSYLPQYSLSTAIGLFNSVAAFILVVSGNFVSKKLFNRGIW